MSDYKIEDIKPYGQQVMLRRLEMNELSPGGIVMPKSRGEKSMFCEVLAVGKGIFEFDRNGEVVRIPATLKAVPGDIVAVRQFEGFNISKLQSDKKNVYLVDGRCIQGITSKKSWPAAGPVPTQDR